MCILRVFCCIEEEYSIVYAITLQATILSSHRSFVTKADVIELSDELSGRSFSLSLFLFTDTLEVCSQ